jgi:hypothetical protein
MVDFLFVISYIVYIETTEGSCKMESEIDFVDYVVRSYERLVDDSITPYYKYSGRGMYGDTCYGIVCSDSTSLLPNLLELIDQADLHRSIEAAPTENQYRIAIQWITYVFQRSRTDNLGLNTIVYFPGLDLDYVEKSFEECDE